MISEAATQEQMNACVAILHTMDTASAIQRIADFVPATGHTIGHAFILSQLSQHRNSRVAEYASWVFSEVLLSIRLQILMRPKIARMIRGEIRRSVQRNASRKAMAFLWSASMLIGIKHSHKRVLQRVDSGGLPAMYTMRCLEVLGTKKACRRCLEISRNAARHQFRAWAACILVYRHKNEGVEILEQLLSKEIFSNGDRATICFALAWNGDQEYVKRLQSIVSMCRESAIVSAIKGLLRKHPKPELSDKLLVALDAE